MNRESILRDYRVDPNGVIRTPGKFEGEMLYVPFYWERYLDGFADSDDGDVITFRIPKEDRAMFPELPKRKRVIRLIERSDGFVCEV